MTENQIIPFRAKIFSWWKTNRRDLPWRHTHDPYNILVSEMMLQQTQVDRVIPKYKEFLEKFPTAIDLAHASVSDVIRSWQGLGYNRRALYLSKLAQELRDGIFPHDEESLRKLPGIGPYTARAVCIFAYRQDVAAVDTNIRKIIVHYFFGGVDQKPAVIQKAADMLLPVGKSWEWHQALMDYGAQEMPKIFKKSVRKKNGIPFNRTDRYVRGRIIDLLREKKWKRGILIKELDSRYGIDNQRAVRNIGKLSMEHLLKQSRSTLSLP